MASFRFELRTNDPDKKGAFRINLVYQHQGRTIFPTGRKIAPQFWNKDSAASWVKPSFGNASVSFNLALKQILNDAEDAVSKFFIANSRYPDRQEIKSLIGKKVAPKSLFPLLDEFILYQASKRGVNNVTEGTLKNYKKLKGRLLEYATFTKMPFDFNTIDVKFYDRFVNYCTKEKHNVGNTIGSYIKMLITFLNWASNQHNISIEKKIINSLVVIDEENSYATLVLSEIERIYHFDVYKHAPIYRTAQLWNRTRDAWCLMAFIGCRVGQLPYTIKENITYNGEKYFWKTKTRKNERLITVPLPQRAVEILEKYKDKTPEEWLPSPSEIRTQIKLIAREAGFTERMQVVVGSGSARQEKIFQKWQLIKNHTARYSFINIMLSQGVPDYVVAAMTGQSIKTIQRYKHANTQDIEKAVLLLDSPRKNDSPEPQSPAGEPRE